MRLKFLLLFIIIAYISISRLYSTNSFNSPTQIITPVDKENNSMHFVDKSIFLNKGDIISYRNTIEGTIFVFCVDSKKGKIVDIDKLKEGISIDFPGYYKIYCLDGGISTDITDKIAIDYLYNNYGEHFSPL